MVLRWDVGDPEVDAFVDASLVSFAAWDLVIYLNRNPATCESAASLAAILARHEHDLLPAVRRFVENGLLVEVDSSGDGPLCYSLSADAGARRVMARFVELAGKRDHRLEFVRRVLAHLTAG